VDTILATARAHLAGALRDSTDGLPDPGPRWGTLAAWSRERIATFRSAEDAIHFAQSPLGHGGFEARLTGNALVNAVVEQERRLAADFPELVPHFASFREPEASEPASTMVYGGRLVSGPMYAHMRFYFACATRIAKLDQICEIGGGFGAPARLFLTNGYRRPRSYVIADLPESLFFAECYLRATLGNDRVRYVGDAMDALPEGTAVLCPITRLAALRPINFDLVINTLSMAEMSDGYVSLYRDWLAEQAADHFYSFNRFLAPHQGESGNLFAPRLSAQWAITWSSFVPGVPNSFLHLLAARTASEVAGPRVIGCPLVPAAMYPLLHAAANCDNARFLFQLVDAMATDFDPPPKEALFLCRRLEALERADPALTAPELGRVAQIAAAIEDQFAGAERDRVPSHLVGMQRALYPISEMS
jgi:putative sugar O-methyltransferase